MKFGSCLLLLVGFSLFRGQAQANRFFLQWLSTAKAFPEMESYLYSAELPLSDSLWAWRAMLALQQNKVNSFDTLWPKAVSFLKHEPALCGRIACSLLRSETHRVPNDDWFLWLGNNTHDTILLHLVSVYRGTLTTGNGVLEHGQLALDWKNYKTMEKKKPWLGAVASALLPGGGSWYAKAPGRAFSQTVFTGLLVMQSYESIQRLGWRHPLTWFSLPLASVFYIAGVYGSARDIIQQREALQRNFFMDVSDYYSAVYYSHYF